MLWKRQSLKTIGLRLPITVLLLSAHVAVAQNDQRGSVELGFRQVWGNVYGRPDLPFDPPVHTSAFNKYRDIDDGFFLRRANVEFEDAIWDGHFLDFQTRSSLLRDQSYLASFSRPGRYRIEFGWDETPHIFTNTARTLYTESSPGVFTLNDATRQTLNANPESASDLLANAPRLDVSLVRKTSTGGLKLTPTVPWTFQFELSRETEYGNRPISTYTPGLEFLEPIDYRTVRIETNNEYRQQNWGIQFGYRGSVFDNKVDTLVFDDAFSPAQNRIDLYPDNNAHSLSLAGVVDLGESTRVTASVVPGWMRQNDPFLPFTINPGIPPPPLPAQSLNGSKQTLAMNYTLVNHRFENLELIARYRVNDYNNNTPSLFFPTYILLDLLPGDILPGASQRMPRQSLAYEFNRQNAEFTATWEFLPKNLVEVGYEFEKFDRVHRDVNTSREHTLVTALDLKPGSMTALRVYYDHSRRNPDQYVQSTDGFPVAVEDARVQLAEFRRFDEAARTRDRAGASLEVTPSDWLAFDASYGTTQDDYHASPYGRLKDISYDYTFDVDYTPLPEVSLYGEYTHEKYYTRQRSRLICAFGVLRCAGINSDPNNDWQSSSRDRVDTWASGLDFFLFGGEATLSAFYSLSAATSALRTWTLGDSASPEFLLDSALPDCRFGGCSPVDFPETTHRRHEVVAVLEFELSDSISPKVEYRYERYDRVDWQMERMMPYMFAIDPDSRTQLYLGADAPSYRANALAVTTEFSW